MVSKDRSCVSVHTICRLSERVGLCLFQNYLLDNKFKKQKKDIVAAAGVDVTGCTFIHSVKAHCCGFYLTLAEALTGTN